MMGPESRAELGKWLREMVAGTIGEGVFDAKAVEVRWRLFEEGQNTLDMWVEILFSTGDDFDPPKEQKQYMVDRILNWLSQTQLLDGFRDVGVWARPQSGAIFSKVILRSLS